jgi:hypothetical protein
MSRPVKVEVLGVYVVSTKQGPAPVIVLEDRKGERMLPVFVGYAEAIFVRMLLEGAKFEAPFSYDLMASLLKEFGARLEKVLISLTPDDVLKTSLTVTDERRSRELSSRPGDGIALGVRTEAPIFVSEELLGKYSVSREQLEKILRGRV